MSSVIPSVTSFEVSHVGNSALSSSKSEVALVARSINPKKLIGKLYVKNKKMIKELKTIIKCLESIERIKESKEHKVQEFGEEGEEDLQKRGNLDVIVEGLLTKVFVSLKSSQLINPILRFSLTDDQVRQGIIDMTIQLLQANVIPWEEIFNALKNSGLAVDVIKFLLTDPESRSGTVSLVLELLPKLLEQGIISFKDVLERIIPYIPGNVDGLPQFKFPNITFPFSIQEPGFNATFDSGSRSLL
ncbi:hypothetical protein CLIB1444_09S04786 [[Candida] jaroonii]|uniref:Uncharacterized protein n=1 Tax=[Candida] jaroonii TaxID=467808 RepID=A0ACA9YBR2_9ASCO|nr:hypothetical protein CLIB1444_09S04786 [[Candida] jaroonii]